MIGLGDLSLVWLLMLKVPVFYIHEGILVVIASIALWSALSEFIYLLRKASLSPSQCRFLGGSLQALSSIFLSHASLIMNKHLHKLACPFPQTLRGTNLCEFVISYQTQHLAQYLTY